MAGLSAARSNAPPAHRTDAVTPGAGQRVVPVTVVGADVGAYIAVGDVVELLASSTDDGVLTSGTDPPGSVTVLSPRATVLSVQRLDGGPVSGQGWQLVVAVDESGARRIADVRGNQVLAVGGKSP